MCGSGLQGKFTRQHHTSYDLPHIKNCREERITFEVVPFNSSYHVIFGRLTYHKFYARPCYIFSKLKIPGPNGIIIISGSFKKAHDCEEGETAIAESIPHGKEPKEIRSTLDLTYKTPIKEQVSASVPASKVVDATKTVDLVDGDASNTAIIGAHLDLK
jgi:hypothetical protein